MTTDWVKTVKKTFKQGRLSNPAYQFKDALKDAKKYYKKGEVAVVDAAKKTKKAMRKTGKKIRSRFAKRSSKHRGKHGKSRKYKKRGGGCPYDHYMCNDVPPGGQKGCIDHHCGNK